MMVGGVTMVGGDMDGEFGENDGGHGDADGDDGHGWEGDAHVTLMVMRGDDDFNANEHDGDEDANLEKMGVTTEKGITVRMLMAVRWMLKWCWWRRHGDDEKDGVMQFLAPTKGDEAEGEGGYATEGC